MANHAPQEPIAIVGIGCRFPGGSDDPAGFWALLEGGSDAITEVPPDRWDLSSFYDPDPTKPGKTQARWGGFVAGIDRFDPIAFGISPREAARMDPQQRLLLEVAWEAIEDGGQPPDRLSNGRTAVFVGIASWDYALLQTSFRDRGAIDVHTNTGGSLSIAANRISYTFDLKGPSAAIDTACSSALVGVHLACRSLRDGAADQALVGGVNALLAPDGYIGFSRLGMLSPDGRCRAFDARANGYVRSEGAGMVLLKPRSRAIADGDRIYALIRGTASNQDGHTPGLTVPSQRAQEDLLRLACRDAGVDPSAIDYVEAHGTGTPVGDPIECRALGGALAPGRPIDRPCLVGSVKTNLGHLEAASGIAGLIKAALALHHRRVPANLHFERPNPEIDFEALRLRVPVRLEPWPKGPGPALAAVNSFGYGGTNAHVILEGVEDSKRADCNVVALGLSDPPPQPSPTRGEGVQNSCRFTSSDPLPPCGGGLGWGVPTPVDGTLQSAWDSEVEHAAGTNEWSGSRPKDPSHPGLNGHLSGRESPASLVPISARSPEALRDVAGRLGAFVADGSEGITLAEIAGNAARRRAHHEHRAAFVAHSKAELAGHLAAFASGGEAPGAAIGRASAGRPPKLAFVCAGQGPQWWAMGRQLLEGEPAFRATIERCDAIVRRLGPWSLLDELTADEADSRMDVTAISQPAIFAVQAALGALWESWGVRPDVLIGHSVGEVAAAYLAGVFGLDDAVRIIYQRGRCMELTPTRGRMLAAALTPAEADRLLDGRGEAVVLAAVNGPASVTLSGDAAILDEIARELDDRGVFHRALQVQYAFHSAQMDPARDELIASLEGIDPKPATIPLISTVTGDRVRGPELGPDYWWRNVRRMVRFADGVDLLVGLGCEAAVELGPHPVLAPAVAECFQERGKTFRTLPSLRRREEERATMLGSLGALHVLGSPVDWADVDPGPIRFVRLPTYPWRRQSCWFESEESRLTRLTRPAHPMLGRPIGSASPAWETRLDLRLFPDLADHRVQQAVILPATAYLEIAFAVARELAGGGSACQLEDVRLLNPCFPPREGALRLQTAFAREASIVRVHGRDPAHEPDWTNHASAIVRPGFAGGVIESIDLEAIRGRCPRTIASDTCYAAFRAIGLDYGPMFRGIEQVWQGAGECLGRVVRPAGLEVGEDELFPPALLDACFQVSIPADDDFEEDRGLYLPIGIDRVVLLRRPGRALWSHARLLEKSARWCVSDIDIFDGEDGTPVAQVRGLRSRRVAKGGAEEDVDSLLYAFTWQGRPLPDPDPPADPGHWLIVADRGGVGDRLADRIEAAGGTTARIEATCREAMVGRIRETAGARPVRGIVHLANLDAPSSEGLDVAGLAAAQGPGLLGVLRLIQAWDEAGGGSVPELVLVTRGAQPVGDRPRPIAVAQAPAIGLGRVIVSESSRVRGKLVDLDPETTTSTIDDLFREILATDGEDEVAWHAGDRFVPRLRRSIGLPAEAPRSIESETYRLASTRPGTLDGLAWLGGPRRPPGPGEVEIEVKAAGLNFSDVMKVLGLYPGTADGPPALGAECSGRIVEVGAGVDAFRVGDAVVAVAPNAFAARATTRAELVAPKPRHLSDEDAATLPIAYLTALYALEELGRIAEGERVLIHSAAGGVGLAAIQVARLAGTEVFATAGTAEKRAYLQRLGVAHVFDSRTLAFADEVLERTGGRGVDLVLNSLAGEAIPRGLAALADHGRFLEIGKRDIYENMRIGLAPFRKNLSLFAIDLDRMMAERPAVLGRLLRRLVGEVDAGRLGPLPRRDFPNDAAADAFRAMQQGKHIGKNVISFNERPAAIVPDADEPVAFVADATYLIAGGLGGFGLEVARWMVDRGAKHLVLMGRGGAGSPGAAEAVADLERSGARVVVERADVAAEADVAAVLDRIDRDLPPLRGVFHAAMVLEDALLANLDDPSMHRVLAPKVEGAWNLHRQTLGRSLDHFILFSSLSSVFGHAGQGNYAAANAFLDALAHHRRALGLPGLAINWGHLGGVGYLARRRQLGERLERQGVRSFTIRQALTLLERSIRRGVVQVSVMRMDWSTWRGLGLTGRVSPRFADLLERAGPASGDDRRAGLSAFESVREAGPAERPARVADLLRSKVARILGADPAALDGERTLLDLGLDSLMAVELRNWIETELRANLPIVELMRSPDLVRLAARLADSIGASPADAPSAGPAENVEAGPAAFPLAEGQRGLWVLHQIDPTGAACNIGFPCRIRSRLDLPAFRRVLQAIVDRHPSLRTTFEGRDGALLQRVHEADTVAFEVIDAASWTDEALRSRLEDEMHRPFDLERGPLVRVHLFTRAADDHAFLLTTHHLVGDYWSQVIVLDDLRAIYEAECRKTPAALPPPKGHYRDFVRWQANLLDSPEGERLGAYWERQLAGVAPGLDLPTDRPRPPLFTHRGADLPCRIGPDLTRGLKALAGREQVTLYTILLAAFQALLGRITRQDDLVVGSPFACRGRPEFDGVVGTFINMLPMRADLAGGPTFRALLRRTASTVLEALEHQDYPFPRLVERLGLGRDPSRTPLAQATFTMERAQRPSEAGTFRFFHAQEAGRREVGGLITEPYRVEPRTCQSDLELVLEEGDGTIEGVLRYNTDLFDAATIARMAGQLLAMLEGAAADPDRPVSGLPWMSGADRQRVVHDWNRTATGPRPDLLLHQLFERQAARTPDAVAIRADEVEVSYAELESWSNRIARRLRRGGVGPEVPVALCLERSPAMVAAILGVLKAGGAFVPLDPASPAGRLRAILDDTKAPIVLTAGGLPDRLPEAEFDTIDLDQPIDEPDGPIAGGAGPANLAYILFTSGSTGRPKGVMVEHRAIVNTVLWRQEAVPIRADDRVLLIVPHYFDPSICIIVPTLAAGATLVLAAPGEERDPTRLVDRVASDGVSVLQVPPSLLRLLVDRPGFGDCRALRWACTGGEPMPADLPPRLFGRLDVDLFNLYGPTEAAVDATWWPCPREGGENVVPIGRPIANARTYVLDSQNRPVPIGVPGELFIGGAGLARGYLGDPGLTAARFVADPFAGEPGARMYRTGDACRWRADGALEFLGRLDQQVKVRGYRIEMGEVEAALASAPGVLEAAVAVRDDPAGDRRLVAFLAADPEAGPPAVDRLRRHLKGRLPEYMIPSAFVPVAALPRTPTGKLDRRALPSASAVPLGRASRPFVAPGTPLEEALADHWREVLRLDRVGVDDDFFELGGSSIQAALLVNRLQDALGRPISTIALFEAPTVAALARDLGDPDRPDPTIGHANGVATFPAALLVPLPTGGDLPGPNGARSDRAPIFFVHPPGGVVVCYRPLAAHLGGDRPVLGIRARGLNGDLDLPVDLESMAAEYVEAIRSSRPEGPYHLAGWSLGGVVAFEMARQIRALGEEVGLLALLDTTVPIGRSQPGEDDLSGREYGLDLTLDQLAGLDPDAQLPYLWEHVRRLGLVDADTPLPLAQKLLDDLKRLFAHHVRLATAYEVRPYPGRIALFRPTEAPVAIEGPADRGWGRWADEVEVVQVPGHHHTMVKEPHACVLARQLRAYLHASEAARDGQPTR